MIRTIVKSEIMLFMNNDWDQDYGLRRGRTGLTGEFKKTLLSVA